MSYVGRYAPSPTGDLHLGNLFAAVWATFRARRVQGRLFLRMEDLDAARCKREFARSIESDLDALGFRFDAGPSTEDRWGPYVQSERLGFYEQALSYLGSKGLLYRCRCSRKDILQMASAPHASDKSLIYPGTCRGAVIEEGEHTALRFVVPDRVCEVEDHWSGKCSQSLAKDVGDFVVRRKDGVFAYHLAVVVDDAKQGVTEVVRGRDLLSSTPRQVALEGWRALPPGPPPGPAPSPTAALPGGRPTPAPSSRPASSTVPSPSPAAAP